ncbi:hypothetical protein GC176_24610 [bacterium]|nr:hypothetical protein [bacterium]
MAKNIILSPRDVSLLKLLDATPLTANQLRKVSVTFDGEPFRDERRVRERMQALGEAGLIRSWSTGIPGGGQMAYYRLTLNGHQAAFPNAVDAPSRTNLQEIAPSRVKHAMATADVVVQTLVACHERGVTVNRILGDGQLTLEVGEHRQQPDFHVQLGYSGQTFNLIFEIDNATEPLDSQREQSIRTKISGYETYQDWVLRLWRESGEQGERPGFRVVFLTTGIERAHHILSLAMQLARNPRRLLVYASTQDIFLGHPLIVTEPIFNDHHGSWQALVDPQPTSRFQREPVRLSQPVAQVKAF